MMRGGSGGDWIFELNEIQGKLKFFKIKGERKRGERGIFEIFIGSRGERGELLEMKLQTEKKISE